MKVRGPVPPSLPHRGPGEAASVPERKGCISGGARLPLGLGEACKGQGTLVLLRGGEEQVGRGRERWEGFLEVGLEETESAELWERGDRCSPLGNLESWILTFSSVRKTSSAGSWLRSPEKIWREAGGREGG